MLSLRKCDRSRPLRSFVEARGVGLTEFRAGPLCSNPPSHLHPSFQESLFPSNEDILQGCEGVVLRVEQGIKGAGLLGFLFFKG